MPQDRKGPEPVSRILEGALRRCGLSERLAERQALARWPDIVGGEIAAHSRAVDLADGVLVLEADHGAWRQEVSLLVPIIIEKFNALCGEGTVTGIRWRDAPHTGRTHGRRDR
jgi:predicted nucleic acid-binding Zn ribbon protein